MSETKRLYRVVNSVYGLRLPDPMMHGYESEDEFRDAVRKLAKPWSGRIGEAVAQRNDFLLLRFDTPGGMSEEVWLPTYILIPNDNPESVNESSDSMREIYTIFDFH